MSKNTKFKIIAHQWSVGNTVLIYLIGLAIYGYFWLLNHFSDDSPLPNIIFPCNDTAGTDLILGAVGIGVSLVVAVIIDGVARKYDSDIHQLYKVLRYAGILILFLSGWYTMQMAQQTGVMVTAATYGFIVILAHTLVVLSESRGWLTVQLEQSNKHLATLQKKLESLTSQLQKHSMSKRIETIGVIIACLSAAAMTYLFSWLTWALHAPALDYAPTMLMVATSVIGSIAVYFAWVNMLKAKDSVSTTHRVSLWSDAGLFLFFDVLISGLGMFAVTVIAGWYETMDSWPWLWLMLNIPAISLIVLGIVLLRKCKRIFLRHRISYTETTIESTTKTIKELKNTLA